MEKNEDLAHRFKHHPPTDELTVAAHEAVRDLALNLARFFNETLPPSREKSLAQTKLEESMMWANAAIARNGGPLQ